MDIWSPKRCFTLFLLGTGCLYLGCGDAAEDAVDEPNLVQFDTPQENDDESMEMVQGDPLFEPDTNGQLSEPVPSEEEMGGIMDPDPAAGEDLTEMDMDTGGEQRVKVCEEPFDDGHLYSFSARSLTRGESVRMCEFTGQVILFVNTAANCGFTPQLTALEGLHRDYRDRPLTVLGFLTNDFADQGGTLEEVEQCTSDYMVTFEQFFHIGVNANSRDGQNPIYRWLTTQSGYEGPIEWNFNKILVSHDGEVIGRWNHLVPPNDPGFLAAIDAAVDAAPLAP